MARKHLILAFAAGTALLLTAGCSKHESPVNPPVDNASQSQPSGASEKPQPVQSPQAAVIQPVVVARPESTVTTSTVSTITGSTTVVATAVPAPPFTNSDAVRSLKSSVDQAVAKALLASGGDTAKASAGALQLQQLSLAQAGTNQLQALAAAATNRVLAAMGMTNQVVTMTTNQVQALLEQAKTLSANQKYQEALAKLTQLYATKLTPEQKQQADNLKAQAQAALAEKAASALGNFLGGKK